MAELTFLFTDVEGSTRLLRESHQRYADLLAAHREALRVTFQDHGGEEVDTQGDAFFVAFASASDAVAAASDAQEALGDGPIRVRMGIHTGEAERTSEGYVGLDVHKCARIAAAAHGGQIVLSREAREQLDEGFELLDLGEHRLKDFDEPVWLFQLGTTAFPPLRTISNTNLPRPVSSFVGREREVADVVALLGDGARLVTLTGPGGSGKTRLAIEAATELLPNFRSGVFWAGLAAVREPGLVTETIARTLGAREELAAHIGEREILLLLDNLEQVIEVAPRLTALLEGCANLRLLVTSRELLRVGGEVDYPVPPLAAPEAVELFVRRAQVEGDDTVAALCVALDNLPLAVELAAARVRVLAPDKILERLSDRLDLFKGGRDADPRHQTLRATIAWSYELLPHEEQQLFARLAVFAGGCTVEAAEAVVDADLDTLQSLVEKSLVRQTSDRFWLLETIREYALERLQEAGPEEWRDRHAGFFLDVAERAAPELRGERQTDWLQALEDDAPNFRSALAWFDDSRQGQEGLRLTRALELFWIKKGYLSEGRRWLQRFLEVANEPTAARANALASAALLANLQGDWPATIRWAEEGRRLGLECGEHEAATTSMLNLGRAVLGFGDRTRGLALFEEAAALGRSVADQNAVAMAAFNLGYAALEEGDLERARAEFETVTTTRDPYLVARAQAAVGSVALHAGRDADAAQHLRESLQISAELRAYEDTAAWALELLGVALCDLDVAGAPRLLGAAEAMREELGLRLQGIELNLHERAVAALREALGDDGLESAWLAGRALAPEPAVAEALKHELSSPQAN